MKNQIECDRPTIKRLYDNSISGQICIKEGV